MIWTINGAALILLVIAFVEAKESRERVKALDEEQTKRDQIREELLKRSEWTDELEKAHVTLFEATCRAMFAPWFSANSFKYSLAGALISGLAGYTLLPGTLLGLAIASPRLSGYFIRAFHILRGSPSSQQQ